MRCFVGPDVNPVPFLCDDPKDPPPPLPPPFAAGFPFAGLPIARASASPRARVGVSLLYSPLIDKNTLRVYKSVVSVDQSARTRLFRFQHASLERQFWTGFLISGSTDVRRQTRDDDDDDDDDDA